MQILSSNLTQESIGSSVFEEWLAEVKNAGTKTVCLMRIRASFKAGETIVSDVDPFVDGPPYKVDVSRVTSSCLAPGDIGVFWDLDEVPRTTAIQSATVAEYTLEFLGADLHRPHPDTPTITPMEVFDRFNTGSSWSLRGSLTARATIHNIGLDIFPIDDAGLVIDSLSATHLETLLAGGGWSFESSTAKRRFARQHLFASWIDGPKTLAERPTPKLPRDGEELREGFRDRRHQLKRHRELLRLAP
jgi:hypothetical protein